MSFIKDTLYFGLAVPGGGIVSQKSFNDFLTTTITPHFPEGFTILDATGQWKGNDGKIVQESSRALVFLHQDSETSDAALKEIRSQYMHSFKQEAVLWERSSTCVSF